MPTYIDTYKGSIEVQAIAGASSDEVLVVDCETVREILGDPDYKPGVWKIYLVADEDEFVRLLKERYGEDSPSVTSLFPR